MIQADQFSNESVQKATGRDLSYDRCCFILKKLKIFQAWSAAKSQILSSSNFGNSISCRGRKSSVQWRESCNKLFLLFGMTVSNNVSLLSGNSSIQSASKCWRCSILRKQVCEVLRLSRSDRHQALPRFTI